MWPETNKQKLSSIINTNDEIVEEAEEEGFSEEELLDDLANLTNTISTNISDIYSFRYHTGSWDTSIGSHFALPYQNFNKIHRKLSFENFVIVLETMKEDDYDKYLMAIADVITHTGFRMLTDEYLTEIAMDIEKAEKEYSFNIEDHYNLDDFPSYKLLRKLQ